MESSIYRLPDLGSVLMTSSVASLKTAIPTEVSGAHGVAFEVKARVPSWTAGPPMLRGLVAAVEDAMGSAKPACGDRRLSSEVEDVRASEIAMRAPSMVSRSAIGASSHAAAHAAHPCDTCAKPVDGTTSAGTPLPEPMIPAATEAELLGR